jgi:hypothetical protein
MKEILAGNAIFPKKICSGTHSDPKFSRRGEGVSYIDARKIRFQNIILVCTFLRKNLQNSIPARSVTKIPLLVCKIHGHFSLRFSCLSLVVSGRQLSWVYQE